MVAILQKHINSNDAELNFYPFFSHVFRNFCMFRSGLFSLVYQMTTVYIDPGNEFGTSIEK
jgi:hypothetical protein